MKKSLLKNLIALAFSLGALVFVAGNVFANSNDEDEGEIGDDPVVVHCSGSPLECARITYMQYV